MTTPAKRFQGGVPVLDFAFWIAVATGLACAQAVTPEQREFFESRIRPVLAQDCYECHNSKDKSKGGLILDHREALQAGGDSGAVIVPGDPDASLLMRAIRHEDEDIKMPKAGAKLEDEVVASFAAWIAMGAPDPRDAPPSDAEVAADTSWEAVVERRKQWWSFRPVQKPALPRVRQNHWSDRELDRFILSKLEEAGLEPAAPADPHTLIRRVSYVLTGLPPTPEEIDAFTRDTSDGAYERVVDRLLASPHFGEHWARHWMDWVRFAESHGSEGDPRIPNMWRYRDYLIRALNADVPYDQLVREHIAGDLLEEPRVNAGEGINESILGTAQYRLVQHGFGPVDALQEQVRFTDNQIDVLSKTFLGLTVSCARCHDHKFDPISQEDFYALYGIMASCRPATITVDTEAKSGKNRQALADLKPKIRESLAAAWLEALEEFPARLQSLPDPAAPAARREEPLPRGSQSEPRVEPGQAMMDEAGAGQGGNPLHAWAILRGFEGESLAREWKRLRGAWNESGARSADPSSGGWDLAGADYGEWFPYGNGLPAEPSPPGEFHVLVEGERVVSNIFPAGVYTHLISDKHNGVLTSPRFKVLGDHLSLRVLGGKSARARLVLQNYPRIASGIYSRLSKTLSADSPEWVHWNTRYWKGETAHIELATSDDIPVEAKTTDGRSWFGIVEAVFPETEESRPVDPGAPLFAVLAGGAAPPANASALAAQYADSLRVCIEAWRDGVMTDGQAEFLGFFVHNALLPNTLSELPGVAPLVADYRRLESEIPLPTRAPGVLETAAFDQELFERGDHKKPSYPVPRRFLEAIDATPYETALSGRLELAEDLLRPDNPLTARVIVNRIWHYVFGRGICATVDNFGRMGAQPTHPELLDFLAARFVEQGWSLKQLIRELVLTETFRMGSAPSAEAEAIDPANALYSHARVRRLEAEAIRDSLLAASGRLDRDLYGPGFAANGGTGGSARRSVYTTIIRNQLDHFLRVFDAPEPYSTTGRRDVTNVPGQSLTLMNDPFVIEQAKQLAISILADESATDERARIALMFQRALGREPTGGELERAEEYISGLANLSGDAARRLQVAESERASRKRELDALVAPVRNGILREKNLESPTSFGLPVSADSVWLFEDGVEDAKGDLHGELHGNARIEGGALVLDGVEGTYVSTAPISGNIMGKTLEAWVQLDNLEQRGGGVISVQDLRGGLFDAIVFAEREPGRWMAGSNRGARSQSFNGPGESEALGEPVHVAIVYRMDGRVEGYRNGESYGSAYQSDGPALFERDQAQVLFGNRHGAPSGNHLLKGRIFEARLYGRALTPREVATSRASFGRFVTERELDSVLTEAQRARRQALESEIERLGGEIESMRELQGVQEKRWQDLAHAIFNFKEFIYIK